MRMQFGLASFLGEPELPCINHIPEANPAEEIGVYLKSRQGLADRNETVGASVDEAFQKSGVLAGARFSVAGGGLYRGTTLIGAVAGTGAVTFAGNEAGLFVTAGASLYFYNGAALATVSFPDGADVTAVFGGASRIFAIRKDTGAVYWTPALGSTFDALAFATAETSPDNLLRGLWLDDKAILLGEETVEVWANSDDNDLPIQPIESLVYEKGVKNTESACIYNFGFAFVGDDSAVYLGGGQPEPISAPWLNRRIMASTACRLFGFFLPDGREALGLRLDTETHVFIAGQWTEFQSYGATNWLPRCYAGGAFGCSDGRFAEWAADWEDFGGVLERRWRGGFPLNNGGVPVNDITLRCKTGQTPFLTGDYSDPMIEMRLSRNLGKTWGNWRARSLGLQGHYGKRVQWRGCGLASQPGLLAEWRVTAPVDCDCRDVIVGGGYGGRSAA